MSEKTISVLEKKILSQIFFFNWLTSFYFFLMSFVKQYYQRLLLDKIFLHLGICRSAAPSANRRLQWGHWT